MNWFKREKSVVAKLDFRGQILILVLLVYIGGKKITEAVEYLYSYTTVTKIRLYVNLTSSRLQITSKSKNSQFFSVETSSPSSHQESHEQKVKSFE